MRIYKSAYFDSFRCIAQLCPDSCCQEWDVQVDSNTAEFYRGLPGPLGDRLRQVLFDDPDAGTVMTIENGRCPMWRTDGLCRIQAELGHDALCKTCREFPRLTHDYGDFTEYGLELSCPEAARLILTSPSEPFAVTEVPGGDAPEYDADAMAVLRQTREAAFALLADPAYTVPEALTLLLFYGYQAQALLDGEDAPEFDAKQSLSQAAEMAAPGDIVSMLHFFSELEILTPAWRQRLQAPSPAPWTDLFRNLARYGVERYWLQAVSDYDLVSRVKMVVISCLVVRILGGDAIETAQLYSKEIENDADNIDAILDGAYTHPALTDAAVLGLLLGGSHEAV